MARSNIDGLKKFAELANDYWANFREDKNDYFNTSEAREARNELNKRYVEMRDFIDEAEGGTPYVRLFGGQPVEVFRTAFSSANSTGAFHAMKNVPDILARTIAFHGNKKAVSETAEPASEQHSPYINLEIIEGFESKEGPFNYRKLVKLLRQLNDNYERGNEHGCSQLIKAVLNHIPPLLGVKTFQELANNYQWSSTSHKEYAKHLNQWLAEAHDVTHTVISDRDDVFIRDDLPHRIYINTILEECRVRTVEEVPRFERQQQAEKPKEKVLEQKPSINVTVKEQLLRWANWSTYGPSFNGHVTIDNYASDKPNYLNKVTLLGTNGDGTPYKGEIFKARLGKETIQRLKIDANEIVDCEVFVSHLPYSPDAAQGGIMMPDLDRDTVRLSFEFADGQSAEASVKITKG